MEIVLRLAIQCEAYMNFRIAAKSDLNNIQAILKEENLPYQDCESHLNNFIVLELDDDIIGIAGVELYDDIGLLRSVAIKNKHKGKGLGAEIYTKIKEHAFQKGVKELYLLTVTAVQYFEKQGFVKINRDLAPLEIKKTKQFSGLCSLSAIVMKLSY